MTERGRSKAPAQLILWHLLMAQELFKRFNRSIERELAAAGGGKTPPMAFFTSPAPAGPAGSEAFPPAESLNSLLRQQRLEEIHKGDFLTNDIIEVRGRLGAGENRQLRINGRLPFKLDLREHSVLVILAHFARYVSEPSPGRKHSPAFLPAAAVAVILAKLTADGGPLAGLWPYPIYSDVHRSIGEVRKMLRGANLNAHLIESGQRGAGYRISAPLSNLMLDEGPEDWDEVWPPLFESALRHPDVQRRRSSGGPQGY